MNAEDKKRLEILEDKIDQLEKKIDKVIFYLEEDKSTGKPGLYQQISLNEKRVGKLEEREKIHKAQMKVWTVVAGIIGSAIAMAFKYFVSK